MMEILRSVARDVGPGLQEKISNSLDVNRLRGLHLGIDPYWMAWFRSSLRFKMSDPFFYDEYFAREYFFNERPVDWTKHCVRMGYKEDSSPIQFRFVFREDTDLKKFKELPNSYDNYPIIYESRPVCLGLTPRTVGLTLTCYDSVGEKSSGTAGTIGGFLRDTYTGSKYLVSCAHVIGDEEEIVYTPGPADSSVMTEIADVCFSALPSPNDSQSCNSRTHPAPGALDMALARLRGGVVLSFILPGFGNPQHLTSFSKMKTGDAVTLFGKKSGRVDAILGSLCIYHEIEINGQPRCFGDIFTITYPRPWYLNTNLVNEGDSGAWIIRSAGGITCWDGMLLAGDGATGYCSFAENIMDAARRFSTNIALVP